MPSRLNPYLNFRDNTRSAMEFSKEVFGGTLSLSTYKELAKGATVRMPLTKAAWGDMFGMLTDRFGVGWLVNIAAPKA